MVVAFVACIVKDRLGGGQARIQTPPYLEFMSGFVPSFSSFPDLDSQEQRNKKEHKSRKDKDKGRSREEEHRHRRRSRSRSPSHERSHKRHKHSSQKGDKEILSSRFEDDDRIKAKQDRERKELEDDSALSREYFVDKRGDSLNIKYGGLHQGDVPKFRRAGSTYTVCRIL